MSTTVVVGMRQVVVRRRRALVAALDVVDVVLAARRHRASDRLRELGDELGEDARGGVDRRVARILARRRLVARRRRSR
eukprot:5209-Pelagococcus_subviridis.AAC.1